MKNIFNDFLVKLSSIKTDDYPAISMFIPLKNADLFPDKIFSALTKAANAILTKDGFPKMEIDQPNWKEWHEKRTATLAIYQYKNKSLVLPLPMHMEPRFVVAKSFHIKPLITAANNYIDGLVLHFSEDGARLFRVNLTGHELIDHYLPPIVEKSYKHDWPAKIDRKDLRNFLEFTFSQVSNCIQKTTKFVGITGQSFHELRSESFWNQLKSTVLFLDESFKVNLPQNSFSVINFRLSQVISEKHAQNVLAATNREEHKTTFNDLYNKIISGKINYLCISLDEMQFGELDPESGTFHINRFQKNSQDDDILDDLIELAISRNVKVEVVPRKYLPKGKSFVYA